MKRYLLDEQDMAEIYWIIELLVETLREKLEHKQLHERDEDNGQE